tara:strand:- start:6995 stop:7573 length:579 start_codon:yes stop_codon:yes gene_type:complete
MHKMQTSRETYESLYTSVVDSFFAEANIKRTLGILFHRTRSVVDDCMGMVLKRLCSDTVQLNLTEHGFCPFKQDPFIFIPFEHMLKDQLLLLQQVIRYCESNQGFTACSQMGMGTSIFVLESNEVRQQVDGAVLLFGLYQLIHDSDHSIKQKTDVYNILTQRLLKSVSMQPEVIIRSQQLCAQFNSSAGRGT